MIKLQRELKFSDYDALYDIVVDRYRFLPMLHDKVDLTFIYNELVDKYCPDNGRPPYDPVFMFKCLMIKNITNLSDADLMAEIRVNMEYKYFLDMSPEDMPPAPSTLCMFRRHRLKDKDLLGMLLNKTLAIALENGIIKKSTIDGKAHVNVIIDGTHTESLHGLQRPVPALKDLSKKLRATLYEAAPELTGKLEKDHSVSNTDLSEELAYCRRLINYIQANYGHLLAIKRISQIFNRFKELIEDVNEYYSFNPNDPDARVGHKTADTEFFGYKTQIAMDEESRLVLDAEVTSGEVGDALPALEVIQRLSSNDKISIDEVLGDTAYSGQPFLEQAKKDNFKLIAPPHPILGKNIDGRDGFTFNKDADMFCCPQGHMAISKRTITYKKDNNRKAIVYRFDAHKCATCPLRDTCIKGKAKERTFSVSILTPEQKDLLKDKETEYFKLRRRQRYKIEAKNAHLKQSHSMRKSQGKGIEMMTLQAATALFTSNLKIILAKI